MKVPGLCFLGCVVSILGANAFAQEAPPGGVLLLNLGDVETSSIESDATLRDTSAPTNQRLPKESVTTNGRMSPQLDGQLVTNDLVSRGPLPTSPFAPSSIGSITGK
jgi:hypothetical protein